MTYTGWPLHFGSTKWRLSPRATGGLLDILVSVGDLLLLRTDGVDEAMSPSREVFGEERLLRLLSELRGTAAETALTRIEDALLEHTKSHSNEDDLTMIAVGIRPT